MITLSNIKPFGLMEEVDGQPQMITIERVKIGDEFEVIGPARILALNGEGAARIVPEEPHHHTVDVGSLFSLTEEVDVITFTTTSNKSGLERESYGLLLMIIRPA